MGLGVIGPERFLKAKGESHFEKNRLVWRKSDGTMTLERGKGKAFGIVSAASYFPDLWVTVEILDKAQYAKHHNEENLKARLGQK